ncbi:16S rRNA (uracil(1498)-N(3))-methyltransferase [Nocardioides bruguierae]|uniref:Ribosomal RNA small subunit methyltransferase E n=1 Tax=Nocardioides bruguierae TaxID=2945102 RepID=A0A9X2DAE6_9ACTN|nr:16S rRNA (uracil(1498)-N(3))-methyltransferase [Nocardioides bruguierae]MCL8024674.1 16S rRNA (uracil(1498)-N(3))-methyltransferase [Nocardioides bruguierae]MCM0622248.1 16S rRNA (uracil(1498)-N(3))-methyltransferase [Nocardioides bruguierae]
MSLPVHLAPSLADAHVGGEVRIEGDEAHHAVAVRRLAVGERVVLTDGHGRTATGPVSATGKKVFSVTVEKVVDHPEPAPALTVVQALPKGDRGELAVEVLTEVGVARVVPWAAARSVAVWKGERAARSHAKWAATAREAAKQARRPWHPVVDPLATTGQVADLLREHDLVVVLHEEATSSLATVPVPASGRVAVVVGPEGGLTPEELAAFEDAGARTVLLGTEVLRTSTAGLAACAALLSRTARWGGA